jgi:hypothetical protein
MMIMILTFILINLHQLSPPTVQNMKTVGYVKDWNIWVTIRKITQRDKIPVHDTKANRGNRSMNPPFPYFDTRWEWSVSPPSRFDPCGKPTVLTDQEASRARNKNFSPTPRIKPRIIQPTAWSLNRPLSDRWVDRLELAASGQCSDTRIDKSRIKTRVNCLWFPSMHPIKCRDTKLNDVRSLPSTPSYYSKLYRVAQK